MKQAISSEDVLVYVRGMVYKIPFNVLSEDQDIVDLYKARHEAYQAYSIKSDDLRSWIIGNNTDLNQEQIDKALMPIRAIVALKQEEYASYRFLPVSDTKKKKLAIDIVAPDSIFQLCYYMLKNNINDEEFPDINFFTEQFTIVDISDSELEEDAISLIAGLMGLKIVAAEKEKGNN